MKQKELSLVDQALALGDSLKRKPHVNGELELAIAWISGIVSTGQYSKVLGVATSVIAQRAGYVLRNALLNGLISIDLKDQS